MERQEEISQLSKTAEQICSEAQNQIVLFNKPEQLEIFAMEVQDRIRYYLNELVNRVDELNETDYPRIIFRLKQGIEYIRQRYLPKAS